MSQEEAFMKRFENAEKQAAVEKPVVPAEVEKMQREERLMNRAGAVESPPQGTSTVRVQNPGRISLAQKQKLDAKQSSIVPLFLSLLPLLFYILYRWYQMQKIETETYSGGFLKYTAPSPSPPESIGPLEWLQRALQ